MTRHRLTIAAALVAVLNVSVWAPCYATPPAPTVETTPAPPPVLPILLDAPAFDLGDHPDGISIDLVSDLRLLLASDDDTATPWIYAVCEGRIHGRPATFVTLSTAFGDNAHVLPVSQNQLPTPCPDCRIPRITPDTAPAGVDCDAWFKLCFDCPGGGEWCPDPCSDVEVASAYEDWHACRKEAANKYAAAIAPALGAYLSTSGACWLSTLATLPCIAIATIAFFAAITIFREVYESRLRACDAKLRQDLRNLAVEHCP